MKLTFFARKRYRRMAHAAKVKSRKEIRKEIRRKNKRPILPNTDACTDEEKNQIAKRILSRERASVFPIKVKTNKFNENMNTTVSREKTTLTSYDEIDFSQHPYLASHIIYMYRFFHYPECNNCRGKNIKNVIRESYKNNGYQRIRGNDISDSVSDDSSDDGMGITFQHGL